MRWSLVLMYVACIVTCLSTYWGIISPLEVKSGSDNFTGFQSNDFHIHPSITILVFLQPSYASNLNVCWQDSSDRCLSFVPHSHPEYFVCTQVPQTQLPLYLQLFILNSISKTNVPHEAFILLSAKYNIFKQTTLPKSHLNSKLLHKLLYN